MAIACHPIASTDKSILNALLSFGSFVVQTVQPKFAHTRGEQIEIKYVLLLQKGEGCAVVNILFPSATYK